MSEGKRIVPAWAALTILIGTFSVLTWTQVQVGTPLWWAPVVAFVCLGFCIALSKCDTKTVLVVTIVSVGILVAGANGAFE
jgi:hypothetical protein